MKYFYEFVFFLLFTTAFMYGANQLVHIWPKDAQLGLSISFALGSATAQVGSSYWRSRRLSK